MTSLAALWLPILLSAVFVFIASSIIHMLLPIHRSDFKKLPDEDKIRDAVRGTPPGQYMFPNASSMKECSSPEMVAKFNEGPVGIVIMHKNGPITMGKPLSQWFVYCVVIGIFVAYLTGLKVA